VDKYTKKLLIRTQIFSHNISVSLLRILEVQLYLLVGSAAKGF